ncbi:Membrane-anchored ubiquitin-fold protein 4, partial [Mucuna pruriens]
MRLLIFLSTRDIGKIAMRLSFELTGIKMDKKIIPKAANDIKLINAGKLLDNNKTVGQCRVPFGDLPIRVITMHVVVQPPLLKTKTVKRN